MPGGRGQAHGLRDRPVLTGSVVHVGGAAEGEQSGPGAGTSRGAEPVRVVRGADLEPADPTPGMERSRAFEVPLLWAGQVVTAPGTASGWHHHDRNETSLYVVRGTLRLEFEGPDGPAGHLDAHAGDFVHVPAYTVHRESNPTDEPSLAVIARAGGGVPTVNVDRPR